MLTSSWLYDLFMANLLVWTFRKCHFHSVLNQIITKKWHFCLVPGASCCSTVLNARKLKKEAVRRHTYNTATNYDHFFCHRWWGDSAFFYWAPIHIWAAHIFLSLVVFHLIRTLPLLCSHVVLIDLTGTASQYKWFILFLLLMNASRHPVLSACRKMIWTD